MKNEDLVPQGSILERDKEHYMLRARLFLGELSLKQLQTLIDVASPYHDKVRLTYRQNIQLYQFLPENLKSVIACLEEQGMYCSGRSGDIVVNALTGYEKSEAFDVLPYAKMLWTWLNESKRIFELPGKFKIAFSSVAYDEGNMTATDLCFFAKMVNGKPCFDVYGGGSLGAMPKISLNLEKNLPAERFLEVVDKLTKLYIELFKDVKVFKKRLRFKLSELGETVFLQRYQAQNTDVAPIFLQMRTKKDFSTPIDGLISCYENLYGIKIKPIDAELSFKSLKFLYNILSESQEKPLIRVGSRHEMYVLNLSEHLARKIASAMPELLENGKISSNGLQTCVGSSLCTFGFTDTNYVLKHLSKIEDLPRISISGCTNACAQHQIAELGFYGRKANPTNVSEEIYEIFLGGTLKNEFHEGSFAKSKGKIIAKNIPRFIEDLRKAKGAESWEDFFKKEINLSNDYIEV